MSSPAALLTAEMLRGEGARDPSWAPWIGSGALRHSLLLKPLACREVNLHVPPHRLLQPSGGANCTLHTSRSEPLSFSLWLFCARTTLILLK